MKINKKLYINENFITSIQTESITNNKHKIKITLTTGDIIFTDIILDKELAKDISQQKYNNIITKFKEEYVPGYTANSGGLHLF